MLRVLYLPLNTLDAAQNGMYDAWRSLGAELHIFDFYVKFLKSHDAVAVRKEFLQQVKALKPNLIHMQLQFTGVLDLETLKQAKLLAPQALLVNWSGDLRKTVPPEFATLAAGLDYSLVSNVGQIEMYRAAGCYNALYWQIGYDPKQCHPEEVTHYKYDVSFTGNMYTFDTFPDVRLRLDAAKLLKAKFSGRAGIFGNGYPAQMGKIFPIFGAEVNHAYCESKSVLSISNFNDVSHYFSDRLLACMASGRPTICYRFPGIESYFANNSDLLIAENLQHMVDLVQFCIDNPEEATTIGKNGARKVLAEHTYTCRALELVQMLNLLPKLNS